VATLIGTPPNLVFAGYIEEVYAIDISFFQWFKFGFPISLILLVISWWYLTNIAYSFKQKDFPGGKAEINRLLKELGPMQREEKTVLVVFTTTAICWITRSFFLENWFPGIDDTIIAIAAGILLFTLNASGKGKRILHWEEAVNIPWGIILLFGGGMALASGFEVTGLAKWFGLQMTLLDALPLLLIILLVIFSVNFITELTSNLATTAMLLPILAPIALELDLNPYMLLVATTVAASCAFMLPVATPPNAVVFGSGYLKIPDMVKAGFWMNIVSIILLTLFVYFMLPVVWDFDPYGFSKKFVTEGISG